MKKLFIRIFLIFIVACTSVAYLGCHGGYVLFHKIHRWNGTINNRWVRSFVHLALWIIPVYEVCILVDFFVLNTVEFWSGSNPLAMAPGEKEIQQVMYDNEMFRITATMNRFDVEQMTGKNAGLSSSLVYSPEEHSWYIESGLTRIKIIHVDPANPNHATVFDPDGKMITFDLEKNLPLLKNQ